MVFGVFFSIAIVFFSALIVCCIILPFLIRRMHFRKIVGVDMNKFSKPRIAEMGGISVLFGFSFATMIAIFLFTYFRLIEINLTIFLAAFITVVLIGFLGLVDDLIGWKKGIRQYQHALFPLFAALPLMAVKAGTVQMAFPFIGAVYLGILYSLLLVPIGITGASNAFNMLAGMNGLEAGLGIIVFSTALFISLYTGSIEAALIASAMLGALIAFLYFNWFPAKIFPGDSLTLMMGAGLAAIVIIGNMEKIGLMLISLYFVEFLFKAKHFFQAESFGIPQKNGTLKPNPKGGSLTHWVMRRGNFSEKQVVLIILGMQVVVSLATIGFFYLNYLSLIKL